MIAKTEFLTLDIAQKVLIWGRGCSIPPNSILEIFIVVVCKNYPETSKCHKNLEIVNTIIEG